MPLLVVFVALASIVVTAVLTWVLWRMNLGAQSASESRGPERSEDG